MRYIDLILAALMASSCINPAHAGSGGSKQAREPIIWTDGSAVVLPGELKTVSDWTGVPERHWAGPEFWCNRLQDWVVRNNWLHAEAPVNAHCRTAHLITHELVDQRAPFYVQVILRSAKENSEDSFAGFLVGAGEGKLDHRGAALVHHYPGKGGGILAILDTRGEGQLNFRDMSAETHRAHYPKMNSERKGTMPAVGGKPVLLNLEGIPSAPGKYDLMLSAWDPETGESLAAAELRGVDETRLLGNVALVSHQGGTPMIHRFREFKIGGDRLSYVPGREFGPVASTLYSVSGNTLKISAQFMHMGTESYLPHYATEDGNKSGPRAPRMRLLAHLEQKIPGGEWEMVAGPEAVVGPEYYVLFRVEPWSSAREGEVRVVFQDWNGEISTYPTLIQADPVGKPVVSAAGFTGMGAIGRSPYSAGREAAEDEVLIGRWTPANVWSPFNREVDALKQQNVDILFFTGDQVYENKPTPKDWSISPFEDYLYKWLIWCWSFRDLTNHLPAIVQPDDHDVYHGNLWGWGGKLNLTGNNGDGGYLRSPAFVNMVHRTMSGHLPDTYGPVPVENGILNYYTRFNWGGVGFAVMEDRKFKTPPQVLDPEEQVLLGDGQMEMLRQWTEDWSGQQFKCMVSQTIYASLQVDFEGSIPDDPDSNGFPKVCRDELLDLLRKSGVFILSGDQHLATFARLGVEKPSDAVYEFAVPAMGNYFWRWFYPNAAGNDRDPGDPDYTGEFTDGFGNYFRMIAVANPERRSLLDQQLRQRYVIPKEEIENGMADTRRPCLGDGYGILRFNKQTAQLKVECWPYNAEPGNDAGQFEGWPVVLDREELDGRKPMAWLPELQIQGVEEAVIQVYDQETGELVKSARIRGDRYSPGVFSAEGTYRIRVGIPEQGNWWEAGDLEPLSRSGRKHLKVEL